MPVLNGYPAGSPRWWLNYLVQELMDQQLRLDRLEDYHLGNHPLQHVDPKHLTAVRHFMKMAQTNYAMLVNSAPVGRMKVKNFEFGKEGEPDVDAKKIWAANDMHLQSKRLHSGASIFGKGYILVGPPVIETGLPTMVVRDPRNAIVCPHPVFPTRSLAGLEMWRDNVRQRVVAILYLPESIHFFVGASVWNHQGSIATLTDKLLADASAGGFEEVASIPNEIGEVPLVEFQWQPDFAGMSLGESEPVLHIQDRINQMILDRLVTASNQAFQKIYATGVRGAKQAGDGANKKGPARPPLEAGASNIWIIDNENAKIGAIEAVDFKQMLEAVRDDVADIAAITNTPAHYLMNRMVNVSGDTLTQAESGFVSKTKLRMEAMGWGWERAMRIAFKYQGDFTKANEPEAQVKWANPMVRKDVEAADAASKWIAGGVEIGVVMDVLGDFTDEQIKFARENKEKMDQAAKDEALALKAAGPPAGSKPGTSSSK